MSVKENKTIIRRTTEEVWNKGNLSIVDELMSTEQVLHAAGGQEFKGLDAIRQMVAMYRTAFPDFHMTIDDMVVEGDKIACRITERGTHKGDFMGIAPTGKQFKVSGMTIHRFAGGKQVEVWGCGDHLGMYQQLGIPILQQ